MRTKQCIERNMEKQYLYTIYYYERQNYLWLRFLVSMCYIPCKTRQRVNKSLMKLI